MAEACPLCLKGQISGLQVKCFACAAPDRAECERLTEAGQSRACNGLDWRDHASGCRICHGCGQALHPAQVAA